MIGEGFEDSLGDFVVGAVVSIRGKYNRVAVWITTTDVEVTKSIGLDNFCLFYGKLLSEKSAAIICVIIDFL